MLLSFYFIYLTGKYLSGHSSDYTDTVRLQILRETV